MDYKNTLHLPKTNFPMKANLAEKEPLRIKFWKELDLYYLMQSQRKTCKKFILQDGPPYANGDIHIGHAVNKILKDIVIKSKYFSGYQAPYVPGWDCHGLPIEIQVEKKTGRPTSKLEIKNFRKQCREYANKHIDAQRKSFIRLGVFGDWNRPYITMDYMFEADVIRSLAKIIEKGHLHKGDKPVHWCINCGSALAEAEVEYKDKESHAIGVSFKAKDTNSIVKCFNNAECSKNDDIYVVIWTTTPWTLPANQAVAVNSKVTYVLVEIKNNRFILAEDLLKSFANRIEEDIKYKVLDKCLGSALELQKLQHPIYDREVPIILGEHVTIDAGTGCVHTAPAHGYDDYVIGQKYKLPINSQVNSQGCFTAEAEHLENLNVFKADEVIINLLKDKKTLLSHEKIQHSYPHCWRHKTPLIFRATPQWFIGMDQKGLRKAALQAIKQVEWIPNWAEMRIVKMIENRPDWCISRQRTWGAPLALFVHKETNEIHPNSVALLEEVAKLVERSGVEAWYNLEPSVLLGKDASDYEKISDTLDVWFDSGVVHQCVASRRAELDYIADLYLEGSDQHRGWFQSSLLTAVSIHGKAPYKQVLTHGFTVDANGHKMSKSLGNVIAPEQIIKTLGADILRLWIASTDYRGELYVSDEILKRTSDVYRRIRNTARFLLANLHDFEPKINSVPYKDMLKLDQWIMLKTKQLQQMILKEYEQYQFHLVVQRIHNFCVDELGSFYLDVIKDRQYTGKKDGAPRRSAQTAIYYVIEALVRWIAPILSFTAEEIWQVIPGDRTKSVFLSEWYKDFPEIFDDETMDDAFWNKVLTIKKVVNKEIERLRDSGEVGSSLEACVDLYCEKEIYQVLIKLGKELRFVFITSNAIVHNDYSIPSDSIKTEIDGLSLKLHKSQHTKCERCWHRTPDVNSSVEFPGICKRCIANLNEGETRLFA